MMEQKVDYLGGAESNTDWRIPNGTLNLWQRTDGIFKTRWIAQAHNQGVSPMDRNQIGSVFQIMTNELSCIVTDITSDRRCNTAGAISATSRPRNVSKLHAQYTFCHIMPRCRTFPPPIKSLLQPWNSQAP